MKTSIIIVAIGILGIVGYIVNGVSAMYQYERNYGSYWELADKSSTIQAKSEYMDKFVDAVSNANLGGKYDAVIYKTTNNSFDANFAALKTLQLRLQEIKGMDVTSFQYQQAISQITAQEQGEAQGMLCIIHGTWLLNEHFFLWDWVAGIVVVLLIIAVIVGFIMLGIALEDF